jgi:hypothetical protein
MNDDLGGFGTKRSCSMNLYSHVHGVLSLNMIANVLTEIQTDHFPNTNQEPLHCDVTFGDSILFVWSRSVIRNGCRGALSILLPLVVKLYSVWSPQNNPTIIKHRLTSKFKSTFRLYKLKYVFLHNPCYMNLIGFSLVFIWSGSEF